MTESTTPNRAEFLDTVELALRVKQTWEEGDSASNKDIDSLLRLARRLGMTHYTIGEIVDYMLLAAFTSIADNHN